MNVLKHMEAVFVVTVAILVSGAYLIDTLPQANAKAVAATRTNAAVPVVVISAKRMSAAEKLQAERAENNQASRI